MKKIENNFVVTGFVGKDAEIRQFTNASVARFPLAVSRLENNGEESKRVSAFMNFEAWRKNENTGSFDQLTKGTMLTWLSNFAICSSISTAPLTWNWPVPIPVKLDVLPLRRSCANCISPKIIVARGSLTLPLLVTNLWFLTVMFIAGPPLTSQAITPSGIRFAIALPMKSLFAISDIA